MGIHGYNKRVFDYPLLYEHEHGFDCIYIHGYPYPIINYVNY